MPMADSSKRGARIPLLLATIVLSVLIGFFIYPIVTRGVANPGPWEYKEFVTILLTVVTIVLAVLGLGIAVLAIWGYYRLQATAEERAAKVAETTTDSHLGSKAFEEQLSGIIDEIFTRRAADRVTGPAGQVEEPEDGKPPADTGDRPPKPPPTPEAGA